MKRTLTVEEDGVADVSGDLCGLEDGRRVVGRVSADGDDDLLGRDGGDGRELLGRPADASIHLVHAYQVQVTRQGLRSLPNPQIQ